MLDTCLLGKTGINNVLFHLYEVPTIVRFIDMENIMVVDRAWAEQGVGRDYLIRIRVLVKDDEEFWR